MMDLSPGFVPCARYHIIHETHYSYQSNVILSQHYLHLTPLSFRYQRVEGHQIYVSPPEEDTAYGVDFFGNKTRHITIIVPHKILSVHTESIVALSNRYDLEQINQSLPWEILRDTINYSQLAATQEAAHFLFPSPLVNCFPELAAYAYVNFTPGKPILIAALELTQRIYDEFEFDSKATDISTPLKEVLKCRRGVCQDFAQLMIGCLRSIGLPARYVSGYILNQPFEGHPKLIGADASHAWVSVYCPNLGWVDFDPTNRCLVQNEHITLGFGRDFSDVTPLRGIFLGGSGQKLEVRVTVTPLPLS